MIPQDRPSLERRRRSRGGFTLVELLVVLLILALLIALLFPAIAGALKAARSAAVQAEIQQLSQALADFNSKNGFYPPSRLAMLENGAIFPGSTTIAPSNSTKDVTVGQLYQRTAVTFRKLWPKVVLNSDGSAHFSATSAVFYDFNGNGGTGPDTNPKLLQGHEALVFFLGGIPLNVDGTYSVIGFGKDPLNPFTNGIVGHSNYSNNRNPPLFEFVGDRLKLTTMTNYPEGPTSTVVAHDHGIPGYIDSLNSQSSAIPQNFYAYFSSTPNGYDPNDVNLYSDQDANGLQPLRLGFGTNYAGTASQSPNPYTTTSSDPNTSTHTQLPTFEKGQSFQIISAGLDGIYGLGGYYKANATGDALPNPGTAPNTATTNSTDLGVRNLEKDNLTNFHNGKLD